MVSIRQVIAARALLGWSQERLAAASGLSRSAVERLEATDGTLADREEAGARLQAALEAAGIEFMAGDGGGVGVRLHDRSGPHDEGRRPDELDATNDD